MSVLVKGMKMPESCGKCFVGNREICVNGCPLVPVPEHGDLIDREPFIQFIKTHWDSSDKWFVEQLEARPTIIPAEGGE